MTTKSKKKLTALSRNDDEKKWTSDDFFDRFHEQLTGTIGDSDCVARMIAVDFGFRNLCGIDNEFPRGKSPLAKILSDRFGLKLNRKRKYEPEFVIGMFVTVAGVTYAGGIEYYKTLKQLDPNEDWGI